MLVSTIVATTVDHSSTIIQAMYVYVYENQESKECDTDIFSKNTTETLVLIHLLSEDSK